MREIKIGRHTISLSNEDRIYFPKSKLTKGDLIEYYAKIADTMLPYMKNRPLTMHRFPEGIKGEDFYQKDAPDYFPKWIKREPIKKESGEKVHYVVCNNAATLVYIANQGCITPHLFLSKIDKLNYPDRLIFDLDPTDNDFKKVQHAAKLVKNLLQELGFEPFVMTTGSRGLHVWVSLRRVHTFDEVKKFAHTFAQTIVERDPKLCTTEIRKEKRGNKVFIDWLRNAFGQTGVAPYAVRAKPGAPVATPITWDAAFEANMSPQKYTIQNIFSALKKRKDPWQNFGKQSFSLKKKIQLLH